MIKVKAINVKALQKTVDKVLRDQIPAAVAKGFTRTAFDARDSLNSSLPRYLDRPTPFTRRATKIKKATSRKLQAFIYVQRVQAAYLEYQALGGLATKPKVVPGNDARLNAYGNLPRGATKGGRIHKGTDKKGRRTYYRLAGSKGDRRFDLIGFIPFVRRYLMRWPFYKIGVASVKANYARQVRREVSRVING